MDFDRQPGGIDLHIHSTASDGTFSPLQILRLARKTGLSAISITDHDTIAGARQISADAVPDGLRYLSGVEISAAPPAGYLSAGSLHILGYGFDPGDPELSRALNVLQAARKDRNPKILAQLRRLGIDLRPEDIATGPDRGQVGRPHIARALVRRGHAESIDDAFGRFLAAGKPAYVDKYRIPYADAVETICTAGGIAVLAHPFLLRDLDANRLGRLVADLKAAGLKGIEIYYPGHSRQQMKKGFALAERLDLLVTGGTDFHGDLNPKVKIGTGTGGLHVPFSVYEKLTAALPAR